MGDFDLLEQIETSLSISKIGIEEFAESDQFCDKPLYPRQKLLLKLLFLEELTGPEEDVLDFWIAGGRGGDEITISPNIRARVSWLRERGYNHFREVVLVGGRRSSKGFCTGMALGKVMWDTLQLQDPGRHYGIDPDKDIYFSCVAGSEAQAKEFQYADFSSTIGSCKAFEPYVAKDLETEFRISTPEDLRRISQRKQRGGRSEKDIAKLRGKALAANAGTLRGSATMALVIDEMAHMIPGESKASADQVYNAATPALDQFGKDGIIFCNSSPYSKVGMFYERHLDAMLPYNENHEPGALLGQDKTNGSPLGFTLQYPSWALFEGYKRYKSKWQPDHQFKKAITVSADWDKEDKDIDGSDLHSEDDKAQITIAKAAEASNPETYKVERRGRFAEVTDAYLNPAMVDRVFLGVPNGYTSDGRQQLLELRLNMGEGATNLFKYKFHLDPSSTTAGFGFAIAHLEQFEDRNGQQSPHVIFDLIKRWNPKDFPGSTIKWDYVINEIIMFADIFRPIEITFDQFQSAEPIQTLQYALMDRGIEGVAVYEKTATLEHNWFRAETFKTAINHGLVHAPIDVLTIDPYGPDQELKFLQQKATGGRYPRVDKQSIGPVQTKDMADCYDDQTEVLTWTGWKLFRDVLDDDFVATRSELGELEFQVPTDRICRKAPELLVHETDRLNFAVTPRHNMLVKTRGEWAYHLEPLEDLDGKVYQVPKTNNPRERHIDDPFAWIAGFWLGDGKKRHHASNGVQISQSKTDMFDLIEERIVELRLPYRTWTSGKERVWHITSKELRTYLDRLIEDDELRLPWFKNWTIESKRNLLEGLLESDGCNSKAQGRHIGFYNTSRKLVDDVQVLLIHLGMCGRVKLSSPKGFKTNLGIRTKDLWYVHIDLKKEALLKTERIRRVPYDGYVYCLTVPYSTLLTRRKGVVQWGGNCMMECVEYLIGNQLQTLMRNRAVEAVMSPGAAGGFRIGGDAKAHLDGLNPNLAGYYGGLGREGEQRKAGYGTVIPSRASIGGRRGMNRGVSRRSRGR